MQRTIKIIMLFGLLFNFAHQEVSSQTKRQTKNPKIKVAESNLTAEQIAKKYFPGVVLIVCDDGNGVISQGSGFFVRNGEILTNYHVVKGMVRGKAKVSVGGSKAAEWWITALLFVNEKNDLALLSINEEPKPLEFSYAESAISKSPAPQKTRQKRRRPVIDLDKQIDWENAQWVWDEKITTNLRLSKVTEFQVGETIYVLSNPKGLTGTVSRGIISGGVRSVGDRELVQIDASISPGSSGGAVLNAKGEVIGIATSSLASGQNLNFAVPVTQITPFLDKSWNWNSSPSVTAAKLQNGWKINSLIAGPFLGQVNQKTEQIQPSTWKRSEVIKGMSYEDVANDLLRALKNSSFTFSEKRVQRVSSIDFSGCTMNLAKTWILDREYTKDSYRVDLRDVDSVSATSFSSEVTMAINLNLRKNLLEETQSGIFEAPYTASFVKEVSIPVRTDTAGAIQLIWKFERFKEACSGSASDDRPTMKATGDWLTEKIEGTQVISSDLFKRYKKLRFSNCDMDFVESVSSSGVEIIYTSLPGLRSLRKVETSKNTFGDWGVWLEFGGNFNVMKETTNVLGRKYEYTKEDKITILFDTYEKAKRVGSAFARLLEGCGQETKEPF